MKFSGEYRIEAPREVVWRALNDPEVLRQAIPGCEELRRLSDHEFEARVVAKVGPVKANFSGRVRLEDVQAPESYRLVGEGKGGAAGFARGAAVVQLVEVDSAATVLRYEADAEVGGKLAQIGSRLIAGTAKKMADEFFGKLSGLVAEQAAAPAPARPAAETEAAAAPAGEAAAPSEEEEVPLSRRPAFWLAVAVVALLLLWWLFGA